MKIFYFFSVQSKLIHPAPDFNLPKPFFSSTIVYTPPFFTVPVTEKLVPAPLRILRKSTVTLTTYETDFELVPDF